MEHTIKILIADDEDGMRMGVRRSLRSFSISFQDLDANLNFELDEASTGEDALQMLSNKTFDIMLLDYKFPGMSGLEVMKRLDEKDRDMIIIMITAYASIETAVTATKQGAFDFLPKPFTPGELKASLRKASRQLLLMREARRLAAEKKQIRFEFLQVLAHELKAPLAAIEGYLNILRDRVAGEDIDAYDKVINRSLVRLDGMRKLIFDLLDLTRIESGKKVRNLTEVNVSEVARSAMETVSAQAAERGIKIEIQQDKSAVMSADPGEIEIIFNNLLSNAVKYNRENGSVDVKIDSDEDNVSISVADTGIGMTAEESSRLFSEFVRIKNRKTTGISGSGLGLSIVKRLALLYGGDVKVESEPDVGTVFTVTLKKNPSPPDSSSEANKTG